MWFGQGYGMVWARGHGSALYESWDSTSLSLSVSIQGCLAVIVVLVQGYLGSICKHWHFVGCRLLATSSYGLCTVMAYVVPLWLRIVQNVGQMQAGNALNCPDMGNCPDMYSILNEQNNFLNEKLISSTVTHKKM